MINGGGFSKTLTNTPQNVQVGQSRFYHHDVRSLLDIQCYLSQGFFTVGKIHLVRAAIAKLRRTLSCFAEWPVEGRRKLSRVTHNRCLDDAVFGVSAASLVVFLFWNYDK